MHIALDGSDLAADRHEGPSVYAGELIPRLTRILGEHGHRVRTYVPGSLRDTEVSGEIVTIPGRPFWTQRVLSAALRRDPPDALFLPIQALPVFRPRRMATVAVVHDLEFLHYPATYTLKNQLLLRVLTRMAVREATRLIAVSEYTKREVARVYGRRDADITVVHHGVDQERFGHLASRPEQQGQDVRQRYGIPERYILFVGAMQPRKNVEGLVAAFESLSDRFPDLSLVLICGGAWKGRAIHTHIDRSSVRGRIRIFWRVPRADLAEFYRHAAAFVLPSFSEGFGMPILEAMASGTPIVTSSTSALPEVAGDAALFVDPRDTPALANAIAEVLTKPALREQLTQKGLKRAGMFSWEKAAGETAAVIEAAARSRYPVWAGGTLRGSPSERQQPAAHSHSTSVQDGGQVPVEGADRSRGEKAHMNAVRAMPSAGGAAGQDPPAFDLSIIIVNWNSGELLRRCLDALPAACTPASRASTAPPLPYEVLVVDNASSDTSIADAKASAQPFTLLSPVTNVGFARANNLAIGQARGEILLLLNPDTEPRPGSFVALVECMGVRARAGIVGGKLLNADGSIQPSVRRFPDTLVLILLLSRLAHLLPDLPAMRRYLMREFSYNQPASVDQVMGACFAIRRQALREVGLLDEGYWIWFEEVDFCRRAKTAGWDVWYEPSVEVFHHQAAAFKKVPRLRAAWWFARSAIRYARKHVGPLSSVLLSLLVPVMIGTALGASVAGLPVRRSRRP